MYDDTNERNLIRIESLDQSLYRVYALKWFEKLLATGHDALTNPTKWEDPFENFFLEATSLIDDLSGRPVTLKNLAADWYGQCWSTLEESDAMWRIYGADPNRSDTDPHEIGVKVKTTIKKLFNNLKAAGSSVPHLQFFVGRVKYKTESEIVALMETLTFRDVSFGGQGDKFADLLCMKREAFQHEHEVRLLFQDMEPKRGSDKLFKYRLDPNVVLEEAVLDPRLKTEPANALKSRLQSAGCMLPISRSSLYQAPHFVIRIE